METSLIIYLFENKLQERKSLRVLRTYNSGNLMYSKGWSGHFLFFDKVVFKRDLKEQEELVRKT